MSSSTSSSSGIIIPQPSGWFAKCSRLTATKSWWQFGIIFAVTIGLSAIALTDFTIAIDNDGWISRGTTIAKRSTQYFILQDNADDLANAAAEDNDALWNTLVTEAQPNFSDSPTEEDENDVRRRRQLSRHLQDSSSSSTTTTTMACRDELFQDARILEESYHLAPLWKTTTSILEPNVLSSICQAELNTLSVLFENDLCIRDCVDPDTKCLAPYSIVWFARLQVKDYQSVLSCNDLATAWSNIRTEIEDALVLCVSEIKDTYTTDGTFVLPDSCPDGFSTALVGDAFDETTPRVSQHSVSIIPTKWDESNKKEITEKLYNLVDEFDHGDDNNGNLIEGAYDNERQSLGIFMTDIAVQSDMILAMGSGAITSVAILLHTKSPWITLVGLFQIILSFPTSYFLYTFVFGLNFFPFLNFIGVFVVFALGADDVFVAMDKWKNTRLDYPSASTTQIAAIALPDAAGAMLLTTTTTAVAFFATAICPVAPLKCFAIFCGLLVVLDYILCVLLVFPALCIYDKANLKAASEEKKSLCCNLSCGGNKKKKKKNTNDDNVVDASDDDVAVVVPNDDSAHAAHVTLDDADNQSLIRRILLGYYKVFHKLRWIIFAACLIGTVVSGIFAAGLQLPADSEVRLLGEDVEFEKAFYWRQELLTTALDKSSGAPTALIWGVEPADTGNYFDPKSGSLLVLDDNFDPAPTASQEYLLNFCEDFFNQPFASRIAQDFVCPMNELDQWLQDNANNGNSNSNDAYVESCQGATGLPVPEENFHACAAAWSIETRSTTMLQRNGTTIEAIFFYYTGRVRVDSPYAELKDEWNLVEDYLRGTGAPDDDDSVSNVFAASIDFWWFDTNGSMLRSAYQSAGIALAFSGFVVLLSSRSFILTLFALITIAYVLVSTTAMLVATGWTLGFLESICFAILIGISCDFVLHFCHAYAHLPGTVSREVRTQYALIRMGPSILAAAFTSICAAAIMLFTVVSFFQQFATILFYTIIQATVGSFVVFTAFADCIGPSHPTALFDKYFNCCCNNNNDKKKKTYGVEPKVMPVVVAPQKEEPVNNNNNNNYNSGGVIMVVDEEMIERQTSHPTKTHQYHIESEDEHSC